MATVTATSPLEREVNLASYDTDEIVSAVFAGDITSNATSIVIETSGLGTVTFTGNFTLTDISPIPTGGTVTGYSDNSLVITGLNVTYAQVIGAIQSNQGSAAFLNLIFGGPDTITGSTLDDFLYGYLGNDVINGDLGNDDIVGAEGIDTLRGGQGRDTLRGGQGRDQITGGQGADSIFGGLGGDLLTGGPGLDSLTGGAGPDTFVLIGPNTGLDTITDFTPSEDIIQVVASAFGGGLVAGTLPTGRFVLGTAAADANDRFIYNSANGSLLFDVDGTGATAAIAIATLSNNATLTAANIVVV